MSHDPDVSKKLREYTNDMDSIKHQGIIMKPYKSDEEIERLLNQKFYNPYDVLQLRANASDDDMKKQFRAFSFLLHPDKCKDPKAKDAFHMIQQSYKTLCDPDKRKVYLRVMREGRERATFERTKQNDKRVKNGQLPLQQSTFEEFVQQTCFKIFKDLEDKKDHLIKMQQSKHNKKIEELETKKMVQQYRVLTQEEWERSREKRVSNWRQFSKKKFIVGSKKSSGEMRPPPVKLESRPNYTTVEEKKKNI